MRIVSYVAAAFITLTSGVASATFISDLGDGCPATGCDLENSDTRGWIDPAGTALDGAYWINPTSEWNVSSDSAWRVWEEDLNKNSAENYITSLFVSYDDQMKIQSGGQVLWSSADYNITQPWKKVVDVIALLGHDLYVAPNKRLNFYVRNTGGPTGVIWKGETASVPAPGTLALLGLGLAGLGFSRRRKTS